MLPNTIPVQPSQLAFYEKKDQPDNRRTITRVLQNLHNADANSPLAKIVSAAIFEFSSNSSHPEIKSLKYNRTEFSLRNDENQQVFLTFPGLHDQLIADLNTLKLASLHHHLRHQRAYASQQSGANSNLVIHAGLENTDLAGIDLDTINFRGVTISQGDMHQITRARNYRLAEAILEPEAEEDLFDANEQYYPEILGDPPVIEDKRDKTKLNKKINKISNKQSNSNKAITWDDAKNTLIELEGTGINRLTAPYEFSANFLKKILLLKPENKNQSGYILSALSNTSDNKQEIILFEDKATNKLKLVLHDNEQNSDADTQECDFNLCNLKLFCLKQYLQQRRENDEHSLGFMFTSFDLSGLDLSSVNFKGFNIHQSEARTISKAASWDPNDARFQSQTFTDIVAKNPPSASNPLAAAALPPLQANPINPANPVYTRIYGIFDQIQLYFVRKVLSFSFQNWGVIKVKEESRSTAEEKRIEAENSEDKNKDAPAKTFKDPNVLHLKGSDGKDKLVISRAQVLLVLSTILNVLTTEQKEKVSLANTCFALANGGPKLTAAEWSLLKYQLKELTLLFKNGTIKLESDLQQQFILKQINSLKFLSEFCWTLISHDYITTQLGDFYTKKFDPAHYREIATRVKLGLKVSVPDLQLAIGVEFAMFAGRYKIEEVDDEYKPGGKTLYSAEIEALAKYEIPPVISAHGNLTGKIMAGKYALWGSGLKYAVDQLPEVIKEHHNEKHIRPYTSMLETLGFKSSSLIDYFLGRSSRDEVCQFNKRHEQYALTRKDCAEQLSILIQLPSESGSKPPVACEEIKNKIEPPIFEADLVAYEVAAEAMASADFFKLLSTEIKFKAERTHNKYTAFRRFAFCRRLADNKPKKDQYDGKRKEIYDDLKSSLNAQGSLLMSHKVFSRIDSLKNSANDANFANNLRQNIPDILKLLKGDLHHVNQLYARMKGGDQTILDSNNTSRERHTNKITDMNDEDKRNHEPEKQGLLNTFIYNRYGTKNISEYLHRAVVLNAMMYIFLQDENDALQEQIKLIKEREDILNKMSDQVIDDAEVTRLFSINAHIEAMPTADFTIAQITELIEENRKILIELTNFEKDELLSNIDSPMFKIDADYLKNQAQVVETFSLEKIDQRFYLTFSANAAGVGASAGCRLTIRERRHTNPLRDGNGIDHVYYLGGTLSANIQLIQAIYDKITTQTGGSLDLDSFTGMLDLELDVHASRERFYEYRLYHPRQFEEEIPYKWLYRRQGKKSGFGLGGDISIPVAPATSVTVGGDHNNTAINSDSVTFYGGTILLFAMRFVQKKFTNNVHSANKDDYVNDWEKLAADQKPALEKIFTQLAIERQIKQLRDLLKQLKSLPDHIPQPANAVGDPVIMPNKYRAHQQTIQEQARTIRNMIDSAPNWEVNNTMYPLLEQRLKQSVQELSDTDYKKFNLISIADFEDVADQFYNISISKEFEVLRAHFPEKWLNPTLDPQPLDSYNDALLQLDKACTDYYKMPDSPVAEPDAKANQPVRRINAYATALLQLENVFTVYYPWWKANRDFHERYVTVQQPPKPLWQPKQRTVRSVKTVLPVLPVFSDPELVELMHTY